MRDVIGPRNCNASITEIDSRLASKLSEWMKKAEDFFVVLGGAGKTHMCSAFINNRCDENMTIKGHTVRYIRFPDVFSEIKKKMLNEDDFFYYIKSMMKETYVVILDGVDLKFESPWQREIICNMIELRHDTMLPTIITTKYTPEEIREELGSSVFRRLFGKGSIIHQIEDK